MFNPVSTYRIQFHKGFTFSDLEAIIPYLQELGIRTLYASPIFEATPGSNHGYDGLSPHRINPEIGTEEDFLRVRGRLREAGISWLQDIVPNHMAFDPRNPWIRDVLEKGARSRYAEYFDADWSGSRGPLMVPFLGKPLEGAIRDGEIRLELRDDRLVLAYYETLYPLGILSYRQVFPAGGDAALEELAHLAAESGSHEDPLAFGLWTESVQGMLAALLKGKAQAAVEKRIREINDDPEALVLLANSQPYRLCHWQETDGRINYRRFFTVNGLICLSMQNETVFADVHREILRYCREGVIDGLRIDHIDGLFDPAGYLERLRAAAGNEQYIIVEKILAPEEELPAAWPVQGNTGYDFMTDVTNLLTNREAEKAFSQYYYGLDVDQQTVAQQVRNKKAQILYRHMGGELELLYVLFMQLLTPEHYAQMRTEDIKTAIAEFLIHCPVYRFYGNRSPLHQMEQESVRNVLSQVRDSRPDLSPALELLQQTLLHPSEEQASDALKFYQRCMQFSGPLMAKGVEDTLMYTFHRFIAHNEVGDAPDAFGSSIDTFHQRMQQRAERSPLSLNATATHDTKRGEDARARLNVLTDLHEQWLKLATQGAEQNADLKQNGMPDRNDEYFVYQVLAGSWTEGGNEEEYAQRLREYLQKALREAKRHSNWTEPNEAYESATVAFALGVIGSERPFFKAFRKFQAQIEPWSRINSLTQVLLKCTCPGVPDIYQGCEDWDFSFVDPDNRRPVDYDRRMAWLEGADAPLNYEAILQSDDGRVKQAWLGRLLRLRQEHSALFAHGAYVPLEVRGQYREHVLAFARRHRQKMLVVVLPLGGAKLGWEQKKDPAALDWGDTEVQLPAGTGAEWKNLVGEATGESRGSLSVAALFADFSFAVLELSYEENRRQSGLLLHITSLPSEFGIGDLGPEAHRFADFLARSHQRLWQLLPVNPTEAGQAHSPYSATSSAAGNTLLISPEWLRDAGWLTEAELAPHRRPQTGQTDYEAAASLREELFDIAWSRFHQGNGRDEQEAFRQFCERERAWLDDFALYSLFKRLQGGAPWYEWPEELKLRDEAALEDWRGREEHTLQKIRWLQFVFFRQWEELKAYCAERNVQFVGDLPFYVSYDSADVWAHRQLFLLDEEGNRLGVAGVPPDAFSADGQLWGMPVFRWDVLKETGYQWWIDRLRRNIELFDIVRLDHFRAFSAYWNVPAGETTARNGQWIEGPGEAFFTAVEQALGGLPFIAEDLGEIDDEVRRLRDRFRLPGMKILQFAFGADVSRSEYIPHNYSPEFFVYTGTHDNNTTRGWYRESDESVRESLNRYLGRQLSEDEAVDALCRMALSSVAQTAILPMQDLLGLDASGRMNIPASAENNWAWRLLPEQLNEEARRKLRDWTRLYNRK